MSMALEGNSRLDLAISNCHSPAGGCFTHLVQPPSDLEVYRTPHCLGIKWEQRSDAHTNGILPALRIASFQLQDRICLLLELALFSQPKGQMGTSFFLSAAGLIPFLSLSLSVSPVSKPTLPRLNTRHTEQVLPRIGQGRYAQKHHIWPVWARVEWELARRRITQFKLKESEFNPSFINTMINHQGNFKHGKAAKLNTHCCHPRQQNNTSRQDRVRGTGGW